MLVGKRTKLVELIERLVRLIMPPNPCHGVDHVLRVRDLALAIAEKVHEPVDREVLELAALLHDIGRLSTDTNHAERSAEIARILLELAGYPHDKIDMVVKAILAHSYTSRIEAVSIEAKILSDADKLDALGAIGIARVFAYSGEMGRSIEDSVQHFYSKILNLVNTMYIDEAKRIAHERQRFVKEFLSRLLQELNIETKAFSTKSLPR